MSNLRTSSFWSLELFLVFFEQSKCRCSYKLCSYKKEKVYWILNLQIIGLWSLFTNLLFPFVVAYFVSVNFQTFFGLKLSLRTSKMGVYYNTYYTLFFFIRTKFIRTPTLRLLKKTKNNSRLQTRLISIVSKPVKIVVVAVVIVDVGFVLKH